MRDELQDTLDQFVSANFAHSDFRGEFGVHDLLWSDLMQPIASEPGLRFAIREGGRTIGSGVVTEIIE